MQRIRQAFENHFGLLDAEANSIADVFHLTIRRLIEKGLLQQDQYDQAVNALETREKAGSTAIGHAVAVPHAYHDCFREQIIVPIRLTHAINLGAPDGIPTRFLFMLLGPEAGAADHLDTLMHIAQLMADDQFRYEAGEAANDRQMLAALTAFERRSRLESVALPGEDNALAYTGRLWGGVRADWARRLPHYWNDYRDGLHLKTLSSTLFLFFACLAPAITFGGIMAELTDNHIGAVEMIVGTAISGVIYALLAGQPLIILGGTGPLLVFTMILYQLTDNWGLPFLETRAWVGLWSGLFLLVLAATDASCLMRFFTRFTDEIFAALISIIFIATAMMQLVDAFPEPGTDHAPGLLTLLLALGTLYLATNLSRFRRSRYLMPRMREFLSDFGPAIALAGMSLIAYWLADDVALASLEAPDSLRPTIDRAWFTNPFDAPKWVAFAAILPAILVALLVFIDQNITARLVNQRDHKLHKGAAYHHDLAIMGLLIGGSSLFGLPWLVAATVRSLNHVRSLATVEEVVTPQGDTHDKIIHVQENRLSGLAIHLLIGASLFFLSWLHYIPMPVLYGLFLFMGVVSMAGNQFLERLNLWPMDTALYPSTHYIRRVPRNVVHIYTIVQLVCLLACLSLLGGSEENPIAILFPLMIVMLVPIRFGLSRFFQEQHLEALDADEVPAEDETRYG
jgi:mannitol/fructose-specific phosphotransferase system IIA component (Ntr-type)